MAIWIYSLSWALIYAPVQGLLIYILLRLCLKLVPGASSAAKYHLALSALTALLAWFTGTWWQQFHQMNMLPAYLHGVQQAVTVQQASPPNGKAAMNLYGTALSLVQQAAPWLATFYATGLVLMLVRLSGGLWQLSSLRKKGIAQPADPLHGLFLSVKNKLQIDAGVQLLISAQAKIPMVIGTLKPMILLPVTALTQLSTAQLESILLHELAHIRRHDYLINILQSIAETVLFFNPFAWMISGIVRREREHCCDDLVVQHTGEPLTYATALTALAAHTEKTGALTIAASGPSQHLFNRIKRIMEMKKTNTSYSRAAAAIFVIVAITCAAFWLSPSFARPKDNVPAATANKSSDEENLLIKRLTDDGLIDANKGFLVEKKQSELFINGRRQTDEAAAKYLLNIKRPNVSIRVYPYQNWEPKSSSQRFLPPSMFPEIADTTAPGC